MLDFTKLIEKHSEDITVYEAGEGYYDYENGGEWVEGNVIPIILKAAVFQMGIKALNSNIEYGEGGSYSIGDIKVYVQRKLTIGNKISWRGKAFTVSEEIDYSSHSKELYIYMCKRGGGNGL